MKKLLLLAMAFFTEHAVYAAFNIDLFPEMAEKHSIFVDIKLGSYSFDEGFGFAVQDIGFDYVLPLSVPVSLGGYFKRPNPNLKSFGARAAYHINIDDPKLDLYALYVFDLGYLRNELLLEYGDEAQEMHRYDFRIGIRRLFSSFCLTLESTYKLQGISMGISLKIN